MGLVSLASCGDEKPAPTPSLEPSGTTEMLDQTKTYDTITKSFKLTKDFVGKDFFSEGIAEANLIRVRDGDTAEFTLKDTGESVVIRYYSIDTPESTGKIEKWGKSASMFAKSYIENAEQIVLEASSTPAKVDSYGSRYLGYVWVKMDENSDWINMNLLMVENGYSQNKGIPGDADFPYYKKFKEAEDFASTGQLHIHGNAEDPYFTDEAVETTLKDLVETPELFYNEETDNGSKVTFEAYISGLEIRNDQYHFTASALIDGKVYNIPIYGGYGQTQAARNLRLGTKYQVIGFMQKHYDGYQISGLKVSEFSSSKDNTKALINDYYLTLNDSEEYKVYWGDSLYSAGTIIVAAIDGETIRFTASVTDKKDEAVKEITILVPNTDKLDSKQVANLVGKKITLNGYQEEKGTIKVLKYSDIEFK